MPGNSELIVSELEKKNALLRKLFDDELGHLFESLWILVKDVGFVPAGDQTE